MGGKRGAERGDGMKCDTCDYLQAMLDQQKVYTENATRAAMEYRAELAEERQQVDALCKVLAKVDDCPHCGPCTHDYECVACWREWSANEARKQGERPTAQTTKETHDEL